MTRATKTGTPGILYPLIRYMRAGDIRPSKVQRQLTASRRQSVKESEYNVQLSRPVVVRQNDNGTYRHIEGQLTLENFIRAYGKDAKIQVQVITIPTSELSDADAIIALNNTTKFTSEQKTRSRILDESPEATAVIGVLAEYDMEVCLGGRLEYNAFLVKVVTHIIAFYVTHGKQRLRDMLDMLWEFFSGQEDYELDEYIRRDVKFLKALCKLYKGYSHEQIYIGLKNCGLTVPDILRRARKLNESTSSGVLESNVFKVLDALME